MPSSSDYYVAVNISSTQQGLADEPPAAITAREIAVRLQGVWKDYRIRTVGGRELKDIVRFGMNRHAKRFPALRGLNIDVRRGESLGVIGPNGAGKSTLLKLIAGTTRQQRGQVQVNGRVSALLELGAGFHPEFSGRENVFLNGILIGLPRRTIEERFDDIVRFSGVGRFIDQPVKTYSSGMFVRLAFSVAVHVDPDILLVDEVLAVGDESFQGRCLQRVNEMRDARVTILFVTHDLPRVKQVCDRAIWMQDGQVKLEGDPIRVCDYYSRSVHTHLDDHQVEQVRPEFGDDDRWGSGEVRIATVKLLTDSLSAEQAISGSRLSVAITYEGNKPLPAAELGLGLFRDDGLLCWGGALPVSELGTSALETGMVLKVALDSLSLAPGAYYLNAAIHAEQGHTVDFWQRALRFSVLPDGRKEEGVIRPSVKWSLQKA